MAVTDQYEAPMVHISELTKRFGGQAVVDRVSLDVPPGAVFCIVGPSGGGKSTLLRCINHLEAPDSGYVLVDSHLVGYERTTHGIREIGGADLCRQRSSIGMVFQQFNLFPHMTVVKNIALAPTLVNKVDRKTALSQAEDLLVRVGLAEKRDSYPSQLSGGQQQRVAIARALAMNPKLMLFDEPTSALDPELVGEVLTVMQALAEDGMTMLIVTHEMHFARDVADQMVFISDGTIVEQSDPGSFFDNPSHERTRAFLGRVRNSRRGE